MGFVLIAVPGLAGIAPYVAGHFENVDPYQQPNYLHIEPVTVVASGLAGLLALIGAKLASRRAPPGDNRATRPCSGP